MTCARGASCRRGGRFNSPGTAVVYVSAHQSLAALELLVHIVHHLPLRCVVFPVEWEDLPEERLRPEELPPDWRSEPATADIMRLGDAWVRRGRTALLRVPSVVVPEEDNLLLNPAHPGFARLRVGEARPFSFDPRLWVTAGGPAPRQRRV
ncbi:MAG TPA: RES family NAD+ phosphorylase [Verrucomicrobiota bacterium]|nr:RES family NAD+ phosphorylase [Verrucomicrobiota bacterium]